MAFDKLLKSKKAVELGIRQAKPAPAPAPAPPPAPEPEPEPKQEPVAAPPESETIEELDLEEIREPGADTGGAPLTDALDVVQRQEENKKQAEAAAARREKQKQLRKVAVSKLSLEERLGESPPALQAQDEEARSAQRSRIMMSRQPETKLGLLGAMIPDFADNPRTARMQAERRAQEARLSRGRGFVSRPNIPAEIAKNPAEVAKRTQDVFDKLERLKRQRASLSRTLGEQKKDLAQAPPARFPIVPLLGSDDPLADRARAEARGTEFDDVVFDRTMTTAQRKQREREKARVAEESTPEGARRRNYMEGVKDFERIEDEISALSQAYKRLKELDDLYKKAASKAEAAAAE